MHVNDVRERRRGACEVELAKKFVASRLRIEASVC